MSNFQERSVLGNHHLELRVRSFAFSSAHVESIFLGLGALGADIEGVSGAEDN